MVLTPDGPEDSDAWRTEGVVGREEAETLDVVQEMRSRLPYEPPSGAYP